MTRWIAVLAAVAASGCASTGPPDTSDTSDTSEDGSCELECPAVGDTRCSAEGGLQTCETDPGGCTVWSEPVPCDDPDDSPCIEAACESGVCGEARPAGAACDDGFSCTVTDVCEDGSCLGSPGDAACDDGDWCNGPETCSPLDSGADAATGCSGGIAPGQVDDDPDDCWVVEDCDSEAESFTLAPLGEGQVCDDDLACTGGDVCDDAGGCRGEPDDSLCVDENLCNGVESCDAEAGCVAGTDIDCDDGEFCDGVEPCDPALGCVAGEEPTLDDGVACTLDACDEDLDIVTHLPVDEDCDDGSWCNGAEYCAPEFGCLPGSQIEVADGVSCTVDACDDDADEITHTPDHDQCDDGEWCNGAEHCSPGSAGAQPDGCVTGDSVAFDDGVTCTVDACDEVSDSVTHVPVDGDCDDGDWCNGDETCDALAGCLPGTDVDPSDGFACTIDTCDEDADVVVNTPDGIYCDDGAWCNGIDFCDPSDPEASEDGCVEAEGQVAPPDDDPLDCLQPGPCQEAVGGFPSVYAPTGADCDDGIVCTTADFCGISGDCSGAPDDAECNDGSCKIGTCEVGTGCTFVPYDGPCDDGNPCTVEEDCSGGVCEGTTLSCNDDNDCTSDWCDPTFGCVHEAMCTPECGCVAHCPATADGIACDDGDPQTAGDFCLAGVCAGFAETRVGGPGFGDVTVLELEVIDGTLWALGRQGPGLASSWFGPIVSGHGASHVEANRIDLEMYQLSGGGISIGASGPFSLQGGLWTSDSALVSALLAVGSSFGDYRAVWGATSDTGETTVYLAGLESASTQMLLARCTRPAGQGWTCEQMGYVWSPNPDASEIVSAALTPQRLHAASLQGDVFLLSTLLDLDADQKYSTAHLPLASDPSATVFVGHGYWPDSPGSGFVTDLDGIGSEAGDVWAVGSLGFLASPDADPADWLSQGAALAGQDELHFQSTATDESGQLTVSEHSEPNTYVQRLHFHRAGDAGDDWTSVSLDRRSIACLADFCPTQPSDDYPLEAIEVAPGRLVIAGTVLDSSDGTQRGRVLERTTGDACGGTLFAASFDDGDSGDFDTSSSDPGLAWQVPAFVAPGASSVFAGTLWFGDALAQNYAGAGDAVQGTLSTGDLAVPDTGSTSLAFQLWWDTEASPAKPAYDQLRVVVECKDLGACPGAAITVVAQSKSAAAPSPKTWYPFEISLDAWQGLTIEVRVEFDTVDGNANDTAGVFLDDFRIVNSCPADDCGACADSDPCTVDGCWLGRCLHVAQCDAYPLLAGFDDAAVIAGQRSLRSIGWGSEQWSLGEPGGPLIGLWASLDLGGPAAQAVDHALDGPAVLLDEEGKFLAFQVAFEAFFASPGSTLTMRATSLGDGSTVDLWSMDASGSPAPQTVTVSLDPVANTGAWRLSWIAHLATGDDVVWRIRL